MAIGACVDTCASPKVQISGICGKSTDLAGALRRMGVSRVFSQAGALVLGCDGFAGFRRPQNREDAENNKNSGSSTPISLESPEVCEKCPKFVGVDGSCTNECPEGTFADGARCVAVCARGQAENA